MRKKVPSLGRAELDILRYIADHQPVTVRQVADHFAATRGVVRTTLLNVMERLRRKGFLNRRRVEGVFQYSAIQPKADVLRTLVQQFVEQALGGSVSPFVAFLVNDARLSRDELRELRQLVEDLEREEKP
jgi:predicted transcriptional regulator